MAEPTLTEKLAALLPCVTAQHVKERCYEMLHNNGQPWHESRWCWTCRAVKSPELVSLLERECERVIDEASQKVLHGFNAGWAAEEIVDAIQRLRGAR